MTIAVFKGALRDVRMWRFGRTTGTGSISWRSYRALKNLLHKLESSVLERSNLKHIL